MSEERWQHGLALLRKGAENLGESERHVLNRFTRREHVSRDTNQDFEGQLTLGQRLSDRIAAFGGSWPFVNGFLLFLSLWVLLNSVLLTRSNRTFDPYPYILLNLILSTLAAIQAPIILMAQNRQAAKDRLDAAHDYEVNLKAELEIMALHSKLDELRDQQWQVLIDLQQQQTRLLQEILDGMEGQNP